MGTSAVPSGQPLLGSQRALAALNLKLTFFPTIFRRHNVLERLITARLCNDDPF